MSQIIDSLNWRYATKDFDTEKKISDSDLNDLLESARLTASSYGLQPFKVLVVTNREVRAKLKESAWGQGQITDASHLLILAIKTNVNDSYVNSFIDLVSKVRGVPQENLKGYADMMKGAISAKGEAVTKDWCARQAYIALGTLLLTAAEMKIDACPMEGFDSKKFDEILGLSAQGLESVVLCPVGYRKDTDATASYAKVRYPKEDFVVEVK